MCVISLAMFLFLRSFVHKPVSLLAKAMQQMKGGNTSQRLKINSNDEIGQLAATFNAMSENLQKTTVSCDLLVKEVKERKEVLEQLVKSERFMNTIFESLQEPFIILDRDYRIVRANKEYSRLRNIPIINLLDEQCHKVIYERDRVCDNCIVEKTFRSSDPCAKDMLIPLEDGTEAWFDIYTYPITDEEGNVSHVIEHLQNITHRKLAEKATKNAYMELEQIFNTAADGMCVIEKSFRILKVNKTFLAMFGMSKENVVGKSCYEIFPDHRCNTSDCPMTEISGGADHLIQFESVKKLKDGTSLCLIVTSTAFRGIDGELIGIVEDFKDISERKRLEEELRSLSLKDELTGLYNRRGFITLAERELKMADRLKKGIFVLYADLDGLKVINDTLGHKEGDEAIKETALVLQETFRNSDIVGRIGGDEFVVLPIRIDSDKIAVIKSRLQKNIDIKNGKSNRNYMLSLSVGVANYDPEHPSTIDDLLTQADKLMYEQKKNKRKS